MGAAHTDSYDAKDASPPATPRLGPTAAAAGRASTSARDSAPSSHHRRRPSTVHPDTLLENEDLCIIGGGTGCNAVVGAFAGAKRVSYCLPVSDDGGSTSEIQRVLGGPALGDLRSRLVRLIPPAPPGSPLDCIRRLLEYRLPGGPNVSHAEVKQEWGDIVEGTHRLWRGIPGDRKETIRAFLVHFQSRILKKAQRGFNFKKASIGNLFLSGASLFLGSVPSAVFLFQSVTGISHDAIRIIPVINTSATVTIAAELEDGHIIAGQSEISHPSGGPPPLLGEGHAPPGREGEIAAPAVRATRTEAVFPLTRATTPSFPEPPVLGAEEDESHADWPPSPDMRLAVPTAVSADAWTPSRGSTALPRPSDHLDFTKDAAEIPPLPSRIDRIFYLSSYGLEIHPRPNSLFLQALQDATMLVFAPGSLFTSIVPCLALRPVGTVIAHQLVRTRYKILLLNSSEDRETAGFDALDFVLALHEACRRSQVVEEGPGGQRAGRQMQPCDIVTHVVYVRNGQIPVDEATLRRYGVVPVAVGPTPEGLFDDEVVRDALAQILQTPCPSVPSLLDHS
ncbi:hypothetical protein JCM8202_004518 [Rhodotorula sphaerocarpa]